MSTNRLLLSKQILPCSEIFITSIVVLHQYFLRMTEMIVLLDDYYCLLVKGCCRSDVKSKLRVGSKSLWQLLAKEAIFREVDLP